MSYRGVKSICIQHACSLTDGEETAVFDTVTYDYLLTRDVIGLDYFKRRKDIFDNDCKSRYFPHYLEIVRRKYSRKANPKGVIYVERKFTNRIRTLTENFYAFDSYFDLQKMILDYFITRKDYRFIYKHAKCQNWAKESTIPYIKKLRASNLKISSLPFMKALKYGDRVITDYHTGSLFEAAVTGKSVLCIIPKHFMISKKGEDLFGKSLKRFANRDEAIKHIDEFLNADANEYRVDFPLMEPSRKMWWLKTTLGEGA